MLSHDPGSYFVIPFLRPAEGAAGAIVVEPGVAGGTSLRLRCDVVRPNGSAVAGVKAAITGREALCEDLFSTECGAAHVSAEDAPIRAALRIGDGGAERVISFGDVETLAGTEWRIAATNPAARYAVLANATDAELFVFVNDRQGPFIPPGGAAKIEIPEPGGALHVTVDNGDGVLSYEGAPVRPSR